MRLKNCIAVGFVYNPSPVLVSTLSAVYGMPGSKPNPAVSPSVLRKVSKSKFSRRSGFSNALKSRLKADACCGQCGHDVHGQNGLHLEY